MNYLNNNCLLKIHQHLDEYELYALRDVHDRFANATTYCYTKLKLKKSLMFEFEYWAENQCIGDLVKVLDYFGYCMTRV